MPIKHEPPVAERFIVSDLCAVGVSSFQGRQNYMEDRYAIHPNISNSEVSIYGIFDGHAGDFAADYAKNIIMPMIVSKLSKLIGIIKLRDEKIERIKKLEKELKKKLKKEGKNVENIEIYVEDEEPQNDCENDPIVSYITSENIINYEKLLFDEIISADRALLERMGRAALFCGTTANIVVVDLTNKFIICANVGDSRAVMCDSKGNAFALSEDHKPDLPAEMERIRANGGHISNKNGCWRVDGTLACSRTLGDCPLKVKKLIIPDPDIISFKFKDFKNLPKFLIMGSDGLFDVLKNQEACDYVKDHLKEHHYGARSLMKKAYGRMSSDNISVIIIKFIKPKPKKKPKPSYDLTSNTYEWLK